jgi:hypothetical protein
MIWKFMKKKIGEDLSLNFLLTVYIHDFSQIFHHISLQKDT